MRPPVRSASYNDSRFSRCAASTPDPPNTRLAPSPRQQPRSRQDRRDHERGASAGPTPCRATRARADTRAPAMRAPRAGGSRRTAGSPSQRLAPRRAERQLTAISRHRAATSPAVRPVGAVAESNAALRTRSSLRNEAGGPAVFQQRRGALIDQMPGQKKMVYAFRMLLLGSALVGRQVPLADRRLFDRHVHRPIRLAGWRRLRDTTIDTRSSPSEVVIRMRQAIVHRGLAHECRVDDGDVRSAAVSVAVNSRPAVSGTRDVEVGGTHGPPDGPCLRWPFTRHGDRGAQATDLCGQPHRPRGGLDAGNRRARGGQVPEDLRHVALE